MRTEPTPHGTGREERLASRLLRRAFVFFSERIWESELAQLPRTRATLFKVARVGYLATRGIVEHRSFVRASSLTYITILSIVPLLAFAFAVAKGFGIYEDLIQHQVEPFLKEVFPNSSGAESPSDPRSQALREAVDRILLFVENTDFKALGGFGLLVVVYAVVRLLGTIESAFNQIWGVTRSRSILRKVSDYLSMVVVTPILLVAGAGIATTARRMGLGGMVEVLLDVGSVLAVWVGFTFLYTAMPNTRVRLGSAAIGAACAATLWYAVQVLHIKFQIGIANYNVIYSSFAAVPIFLVWSNFSWVIVLLGAELACAHQTEPTYARIEKPSSTTYASRELLALRAAARIARRFLDGAEPLTAAELALEIGVPVRDVALVLDTLRRAGILAETDRGAEIAYLPGRDLDRIRVKSVLDALRGSADHGRAGRRGAVDVRVEELLAGVERELEVSGLNVTLRELAASAEEPSEPQRVPAPRGKGSARSAAT